MSNTKFGSYDPFLQKLALSSNTTFDAKFFIAKKYSASETTSVKNELIKPAPFVFFANEGTVLIGSDKKIVIKNPLSSPLETTNITSLEVYKIPIGEKGDKFFLSQNYKWILYYGVDNIFYLLYNPIHGEYFQKMLGKEYPASKDASGNYNSTNHKNFFNDIQNYIVNPYCGLVGSKDPLCICSTGNNSKICTDDLFNDKMDVFNSMSSDAKNQIQSNCKCFNQKCITSSDATVKNYISPDNAGVCDGNITIAICNKNYKAGGSIDIKSDTQNCSASSSTTPTPVVNPSPSPSPSPPVVNPSPPVVNPSPSPSPSPLDFISSLSQTNKIIILGLIIFIILIIMILILII